MVIVSVLRWSCSARPAPVLSSLLQGPPTVLVPPLDRSVPFDVGWDYIGAILKEEDAGTYPCSGAVAGEVRVLSHLVKVQRYCTNWLVCVQGWVCGGGCACVRVCGWVGGVVGVGWVGR